PVLVARPPIAQFEAVTQALPIEATDALIIHRGFDQFQSQSGAVVRQREPAWYGHGQPEVAAVETVYAWRRQPDPVERAVGVEAGRLHAVMPVRRGGHFEDPLDMEKRDTEQVALGELDGMADQPARNSRRQGA